MRYRSLLILLISLLGMHVLGQIAVHSAFDADSIMLGKHVSYSISVESGDDVVVVFPEYSDTISKQLEIISSTDTDTTFSGENRILTREYTLTSFEPGWNTLRPQPVVYNKDDITDTIYTDALLLTVLAPAIDTTQAIKPIKPPVNTPVSFAEIFPWSLLGLGLVLLTILGIYLYRRYKRKHEDPEYFQRKPMEPAHVVAFRELDLLRGEKLPQNGKVKEYYTRLTEIIRVYITRQYNIHAMESTTSEILVAFSEYQGADGKLPDLLEELLMLADLVKFAKEDPLMDENERHLANAKFFVEHTYRLFINEEEESTSDEENSAKGEESELIKEEEKNG